MLNDPRSHGLWEKTAPLAPVTSRLEDSVSAAVAIVGGGYAGLSAALHLAEAGANVVLLEAAEIGFGAAGRNVGLINAGMWVMPNHFIEQLGPHHAEKALDLLGNAPYLVRELIKKHGIECELEERGTLHCAADAAGMAELEERTRQWQMRGAPVTLVDAAGTASRTGSNAYCGSLLDMRAGTLQPLAYVRGLAHAAVKAGTRLYTQSPVIGTSEANNEANNNEAGGKRIVKTAGGEVAADWVIVATDAYSTGPYEAVRREQVHLPYFNLATAPLGDNLRRSILPGGEGCCDTRKILSSFRMDKAGRLVFGSVGALRGTGTAIHKDWARRSLKRLFPQLENVEFETEWYGNIGMTDNALPRFHRFGDNIVGFSGYNGRGIAPGTVFGKLLAGLVLGQVSEAELPLPPTAIREPAFRALKEACYEAGAQVVHFAGERF